MAKPEPQRKRGRKPLPPQLKAFPPNKAARKVLKPIPSKDSPTSPSTDLRGGSKKSLHPPSFTFMGFHRASGQSRGPVTHAGVAVKPPLNSASSPRSLSSSSPAPPLSSITSPSYLNATSQSRKGSDLQQAVCDPGSGAGLDLKTNTARSPGAAQHSHHGNKLITSKGRTAQANVDQPSLGLTEKNQGLPRQTPLTRVPGPKPPPFSPQKTPTSLQPLNLQNVLKPAHANNPAAVGNVTAPASSLRVAAASPATRKAAVGKSPAPAPAPATPGGQTARKTQPGAEEPGATPGERPTSRTTQGWAERNPSAESPGLSGKRERSASKDGKLGKMAEMSTGEDESSSDSDQDPGAAQDLSISVQTGQDWKPPRSLIEHVFVTDVTANLVTVTVKESPTSVGFFNLRNY